MFTFDQAGLKELDAHLTTSAFVDGFVVSRNDSAAYMTILEGHIDISSYPHIQRWYKHISTYTMAEFTSFPGEITACACPCSGTECSAQPVAPAKQEEEADDFNFDDDDEDDEKAKAEMEALKKAKEEKPKKAKKQDRSMIVLYIKPYGDENDMQKVLDEIPSKIVMEGLKWGIGELLDHCYGVKMLAMPCVVVDDLVSIDDVCELIQETFADDVQNCDIHSFNKCE